MPIGFMGFVWLAYVSVTDRPRAWTEWVEAAAIRPMTRSLALLAVLVALAALLAACGDDDSSGSSEPAAGTAEERQAAETTPAEPAETPSETAAAAPTRRRGPLLKLRDSQLGPVLFSGRDRALYLFTRDRGRKSRCYDSCAAAWPPFYTKGRPRAGRGVDADLLGTATRRNGRRQVTYKGQPLYFYVSDPKGEVLCNDIAEFGGTWFALTAAGNPPA
jgi:predicted lipoprotein with Yx(FWY)xxD motif